MPKICPPQEDAELSTEAEPVEADAGNEAIKIN